MVVVAVVVVVVMKRVVYHYKIIQNTAIKPMSIYQTGAVAGIVKHCST